MKLNQRRRGAALVSVIATVFVTSAILAVTVSASAQRAFMARRLSNRIHAATIAESGANHAYSVLVTNFEARHNAENFPSQSFAGGYYSVGVFPIGDNMAVIHSTGTYKGVEGHVILDIKDFGEDTPGSPGGGPAYGLVILAGGTVTWQGASQFINGGLVHGNQAFTQGGSGYLDGNIASTVSIRINGSSGYIGGDAMSPVVSGHTDNIHGTIYRQTTPAIAIPQIDLTPYYNHAVANGEVRSGKVTINSDYVVKGGVMWIDGSLTISGTANVTGCFIATGDIDITGSGNQIKVAGYPSFVSRDGDIKIAGSGNWHGLMYARLGDIDFTGGGTVTGSIICGGDFKKAGGSTVFAYEKSTPVAPGEDGTQTGIIVATAWQK